MGREKAKKATQTILKEGPTKMSIANSEKSHDQFQWMSMCERIMGNFFSCLAFPLIMAIYLFLLSIFILQYYVKTI